ncbi:MAG: hypothetical protein CMH25_00045 [Micavibrio sp.]|nr:hypothetical protein [Micavibrio sp.]|tara:strand:+ start:1803 stop:2198 length:396 start_codon:yes stop_codon:yes gene_type:complete
MSQKIFKAYGLTEIFCDIAGTLCIKGDEPGESITNQDVLTFLRHMRDAHDCDITLCSRVEGNALARPSLTDEFTDVYGKASYRDRLLPVLIDDNPNEYLKAQLTIHPDKLKGFTKIDPSERAAFLKQLLPN